MDKGNQKLTSFQFTLFNEILDRIVVARGVEALSLERGGRGFSLNFNLNK
jgi:hypothetical protein